VREGEGEGEGEVERAGCRRFGQERWAKLGLARDWAASEKRKEGRGPASAAASTRALGRKNEREGGLQAERGDREGNWRVDFRLELLIFLTFDFFNLFKPNKSTKH
jgi:hypothetical protein